MAFFEGYQSRGTWIDQIDPRTKLAWLIFVFTTAFINNDLKFFAIMLVVLFALSLSAGVPTRIFINPSLLLLLITAQLFLIQVLFCRQGYILYRMGPINIYSEAAPLAIEASLRIAVIVLSSVQFLAWTSPSTITVFLVKSGIPYRFAMLAGLALRFLPLMERELGAVFESQGVRGLPMTSGFQKLKALLPVSLPFLYRAFRRANETALAMELRGFGRLPTRTFLMDLKLKGIELAGILLMAAIIIGELWVTIKSAGL